MNGLNEQDSGKYPDLSPSKKFEVLKFFQGIKITIVAERGRILPTVSSLAATLLAVATFNDNLFPINVYTRVVLSILLALIPLTLWAHNKDLEQGHTEVNNEIRKLMGESQPLRLSCTERFFGLFPRIVIYFIGLAIASILVLLWY